MDQDCNHPLTIMFSPSVDEIIRKRVKKQTVSKEIVCVLCGKTLDNHNDSINYEIINKNVNAMGLTKKEYLSIVKEEFINYVDEYKESNKSFKLSQKTLAKRFIISNDFLYGKEHIL